MGLPVVMEKMTCSMQTGYLCPGTDMIDRLCRNEQPSDLMPETGIAAYLLSPA